MPFFQYTATDRAGKRINGALQAATAEAAQAALVQAGLGAVQIRAGTAPVSSPRPPAPSPIRPAAPVPVPGSSTPTDIVKTGAGRPVQLFFLLTQLASLQNAGIGPSLFLRHLADKAPKTYRPSLDEAATRTAQEGFAISDVFARYPNLYPRQVVGHLRVGERSGHFAEAVQFSAEVVDRSRRLAARLAYFPVIASIMIVVYPLSMGVIQGALESMKAQDKSGGSLPVGPTIMNSIIQQMKLYGPTALVALAVVVALWKIWMLPGFSGLRHQLGYRLFPSRSRSEGIRHFSWALGQTSQAGLPYYEGFRIAADCIPNDVLRNRLLDEAGIVREGEPLSHALRRSSILPPQYADVVETAEMTGDIPRAMDQLGRAANADFEQADGASLAKGRVLLYLGLGALTLIFTVSLFRAWYGGIIDWGTSEDFLNLLMGRIG